MLLTALNTIKISAVLMPLSAGITTIYQLIKTDNSLGSIIATLPPVLAWSALLSAGLAVLLAIVLRQIARHA